MRRERERSGKKYEEMVVVLWSFKEEEREKRKKEDKGALMATDEP